MVRGEFVRVILCIFLAVPLLAGEYAVLNTGFRIHAKRHEVTGEQVSLFTETGRIDLPADSIVAFEDDEASVDPRPEKSTAKAVPKPSPAQLVEEAAKRWGLPPELLHSLAATESSYRPDAVSRKGAIGIMQLMPATAAELNADPADPEQNVDAGARLLGKLLVKYDGGLYRALAAYNAGPGSVARYKGIPPYRETQLYVQRVLDRYKKLHRRSASSAK